MDRKKDYPILEIMSAPDLEFSSGKQQHIIQVRIYFRMEMENSKTHEAREYMQLQPSLVAHYARKSSTYT